jgi:uncharacterized lipoprotein YddW (UPF0748 family)
LKRTFALILCILLFHHFGLTPPRLAAPMPNPAPPKAELRAFWVDGFHPGFRTPEEAERLVAGAKKSNINALIVQVRRRADSFYTKSFEPPVEDPAYDPKFDALANLLELAHRQGMEVHAWINATPVWSSRTPPHDRRHILHTHGLSEGRSTWLTLTPEGNAFFAQGYFLDPGHPLAAQYLTDVYLNMIRNYEVDGIHFDYIRYPEAKERAPRGATVGYNPTSLERFRRATGYKGVPAPNNPMWMAWRRQQVTQLVRKIYLEAKAINPRIKVSTAAVAWGRPPSGEEDFLDSVPAQHVFQDWHSWLQEGIIDLAVPMNYAKETNPTTKAWFDGWIRWEKQHKHGRQLVIGLGNYLNRPEATLAQVERVRQNESEIMADGLAFYSYATPTSGAFRSQVRSLSPPLEISHGLEYLVWGSYTALGPLHNPVPIPTMDWIEHPRTGWLAGVVRGPDGRAVDNAPIVLRAAASGSLHEVLHTTSDGSGYFGFADLAPGRYEVEVDNSASAARALINVEIAHVARIELRLRDGISHPQHTVFK